MKFSQYCCMIWKGIISCSDITLCRKGMISFRYHLYKCQETFSPHREACHREFSGYISRVALNIRSRISAAKTLPDLFSPARIFKKSEVDILSSLLKSISAGTDVLFSAPVVWV